VSTAPVEPTRNSSMHEWPATAAAIQATPAADALHPRLPASPVTRPPGTPLPEPHLRHLRRLTDDRGVWEHTKFDEPRIEHGYCTDDNARALVVACHHQGASLDATVVAAVTLRFVLDARDGAGRFRNRRRADGVWLDEPRSDDADGRALWALGTAARCAPAAWQRDRAAAAFETVRPIDSPHLRPHATAVLGAVEMLAVDRDHVAAKRVAREGAARIADAASRRGPWIEPRLTYDDARLPEALLAAGGTLRQRSYADLGLELLSWLVDDQMHEGHFSYTPVGGREPGGPRPAFDQQPLEAAAMAAACARAWSLTAEPVWRELATRAAGWLLGANDTGAVLYDTVSGGTCDGLAEHSVNLNRGAESTIAGIEALQAAGSTRSPLGLPR
jgi:hypothetical protein